MAQKCRFCGAGKAVLDRGDDLETHAYAFIHTDDIKARIAELFGDDMQFDVIIGNPPYQMTGGGGGTNDSPIYNLFVEQAMRLEPRFLSMVIPSRWMAGGRGLNEFRAEFLGDPHVRSLVDYENAKDVFPTVGIGGGICYFLWDRDEPGPVNASTTEMASPVAHTCAPWMSSMSLCVTSGQWTSLTRSWRPGRQPFEELVSGDTPFGLATNFKDYVRDAVPGLAQIRLYANFGTTRVRGVHGARGNHQERAPDRCVEAVSPEGGLGSRARAKRRGPSPWSSDRW